MKLNYSSKRTFTTADFFDMADPPLIFEVRGRPSSEWAKLYGDFEDANRKDVEIARQMIALAFLTVSQEGSEVYPLNSLEAVQSLQEAVEVNDPGNGEKFICDLAWSMGRKYFQYLETHLGNLPRSLEQSNGSAKTPSPAKAS